MNTSSEYEGVWNESTDAETAEALAVCLHARGETKEEWFMQFLVEFGPMYHIDMHDRATQQEEDIRYLLAQQIGREFWAWELICDYVRWCIALREKGRSK